MRPKVRIPLEQGLRYLRATRDSVFPPRVPSLSDQFISQLLDRLRVPSPSEKIAVLWELERRPPLEPQSLPPIRRLLRDRDPDVAVLATHLLSLAEGGDTSGDPTIEELKRAKS